MLRLRRKSDSQPQSYPCEGVYAADDLLHRQTENRIFTLLWKALIVYCIVGGGMGCLLSALGTKYHVFIVQIIIFLSSIFLASLFYHHVWENTGYILLFLIMVFVAYTMRSYINSGFYGVLNDIFEAVSDYFDSNAMRSYGERVGNRELAITVSMSYIGVVCCLVINISISRRMQYGFSVLAVMTSLFLPLYLELEPSLFFVVVLLTGLCMAAGVRRSRHYTLHPDNTKYERNKHGYTYNYSMRTMVQLAGCLIVLIGMVALVLSVIAPKDTYHEKHPTGQWKRQTADTVENFSVAGIAGLFNFYDNVGGLTSGRLGGVSSLRLDYETDLKLTFVPAAEERFYLRQFVGVEYEPYSNQWNSISPLADETERAMQEAYEAGGMRMGKGLAIVENVAGQNSVYQPYYSLEAEEPVWIGHSQSYTYYRDFEEYNREVAMSLILRGSREKEELRNYQDVPAANLGVIDDVIKEAGLDPSADPADNVARLMDYYQENIPYSYQPGITPFGNDFVNYFLQENKRGYCAHFASAAVLIFRELGIPARYVEGYAIDPEDINEEGHILKNESKESYYEGYTDLDQTAVVSVNVTDANAHAWVEIWVAGQGWQIADVTPASDEEEPGDGLWGMFRRFFGNGMGGAVERENETTNTTTTVTEMAENVVQIFLKALAGLLAVVLLVLVLRMLIQTILRVLRTRNMDRNDLLIDYYQRHVRKIGHSIPGFDRLQNHKEQIAAMIRQGQLSLSEEESRRLLSLLEQAGFSPVEVTEQEDRWVRQVLRESGKKRLNKDGGKQKSI